jgi:hypothetical protein
MKSQLCLITNWAYDSLGQVASGKGLWKDGTPVAGQQFEYAYDDIGNRKMAGRGGDRGWIPHFGTDPFLSKPCLLAQCVETGLSKEDV